LTLLGVILPAGSKEATRLSWAEPTYVYDVRDRHLPPATRPSSLIPHPSSLRVRSGRPLGRIREIALPPPADGRRVHLFALQAETVAGVTVTGPEQVARGETLPLEVQVEAGQVDPAGRLVRIDVLDPAGQPVLHYRDFVTLAGPTGQSAVPFAFNDVPGRWTIRATDVASGVAGEKTVVVSDDKQDL
jgi:hypothetical protein